MKILKVGEKVWYVPSDKRHSDPNGTYLEVTKVGKKFTYVNGMKCEGWTYNGYNIGKVEEYPYGSIYATEQDYLDHMKWNKFTYNIPSNLTKEQKQQILMIVNGAT